jgi:anti-sigma factor RsiW
VTFSEETWNLLRSYFVISSREMFGKKSECQQLRGMLSPYIDGELSSSEKISVERHIEECDACRRELESLRATVGLLRRVPMVAPRRSFTIAARAPRRHPVAWGALRAATAVAVLVLAFVFIGDALNLIGAGPVEDKSVRQEFAATETPVAEPAGGLLGEGDLSAAEAEGVEVAEGTSSLRNVELALAGVVVVLGGATAAVWLRLRREQEKGAEALVRRRGGRRK